MSKEDLKPKPIHDALIMERPADAACGSIKETKHIVVFFNITLTVALDNILAPGPLSDRNNKTSQLLR